MGKPKRERSLPDNEAQAVARNLRVSPRKLNLVAGLIRGKKVDHALADLEFSRKRIAQDVKKCVMSAVANAENNHGLDVNDLVVSEAYVGKNLVMKRFQARGRGRASSILKPFSQITIIVRQSEGEESGKRRAAKGKEEAKPAAKSAKPAKPAKSTKPAKAAKAGEPAKEAKAAKAAASKKSIKAGKAAKETE
jgi:large subunit ribosomal protein L22